MPYTAIIRVPNEKKSDFQIFWKELRISEMLSPEFDLSEPVETQNFDGAALAEWTLTVLPFLSPILAGILGYLIAARGELEIEIDDKKIKMKNMKPSQLKEIMTLLDTKTDDGS